MFAGDVSQEVLETISKFQKAHAGTGSTNAYQAMGDRKMREAIDSDRLEDIVKGLNAAAEWQSGFNAASFETSGMGDVDHLKNILRGIYETHLPMSLSKNAIDNSQVRMTTELDPLDHIWDGLVGTYAANSGDNNQPGMAGELVYQKDFMIGLSSTQPGARANDPDPPIDNGQTYAGKEPIDANTLTFTDYLPGNYMNTRAALTGTINKADVLRDDPFVGADSINNLVFEVNSPDSPIGNNQMYAGSAPTAILHLTLTPRRGRFILV